MRWRADKNAANALLGKVFLYRASMATDAALATQYYTQSKTYSGAVITSGQYSLQPDYKDLWYYYNTNNKHGVESIFELENGYISTNGSGYPNNSNQLHMFTGLNLLDANLGCQMYTRYGPSFYTYDTFSNADYRKGVTFVTTFALSTGKTITWYESNLGQVNISPGNWPVSYPGNMKMWDRSPSSYSYQAAASDIYIIRYAEVLLNYAEAENALNGPTGDALAKINAVRARATLPALTGLSQQQLSDAIYQERTWEFIGEGQLYYDALRTDRLSAQVTAEVNQGVANKYLNYLPLAFKPKKTFLWKIPTYDLNSNPALVQNPDNVSN